MVHDVTSYAGTVLFTEGLIYLYIVFPCYLMAVRCKFVGAVPLIVNCSISNGFLVRSIINFQQE